MPKHLDRALRHLDEQLLAMSSDVTDVVLASIKALRERTIALAYQVIALEPEIDRDEIDVEEQCLKLLALHQPVASDLRRIVAVLRINTELERTADVACNIAERAVALIKLPPVETSPRLERMGCVVGDMLKHSIESFVSPDVHLARRVARENAEVERLGDELTAELLRMMKSDTSLVPAGLSLFSTFKHLARIAGHATNIAADAVFLVEGEIVRHSGWSREANGDRAVASARLHRAEPGS